MAILDLNTLNALKESAGADFVDELMDAFIKDSIQQMEKLRGALETGDADTFRRAAHTIKSNALTFGAEDLAVLARELEMLGRDKNLEAGNRLEVLKEAFELLQSELLSLK
ncbi:MAG: Hpt domain-containing protein [Anaerolineales bacterium]|jgi:HPt (histidine-containing phosphotransfer) domain-containing protein|nr:Hpt domain-containing protein [Chloroflexota bacterium]MBK6647920.1 Hpt domain-containing protein [Anaerolineales bacterium]MCC6985234.1 Hpt domain-containing protein [Anaerolineales bacterium]